MCAVQCPLQWCVLSWRVGGVVECNLYKLLTLGIAAYRLTTAYATGNIDRCTASSSPTPSARRIVSATASSPA